MRCLASRYLRGELMFSAVNVQRLRDAVRVVWGEDDVGADDLVAFRFVVCFVVSRLM